MKSRRILLFAFLALPYFLLAQNDSIARAEEYFKLGMEVFNYEHRKQATELFEQAVQWNPKSARANLMAGKSIMLTVHKETSLPYFRKAWELDPRVDDDILYLIGRAYHYNEQFDSAILFYDRFNRVLARSMRLDKSNRINEVNRRIFDCRNAVLLMESPIDVTITLLSDAINSEYPDYAPTINANENLMVFTSRRPEQNTNASIAADMEYFEEVYQSSLVNGTWEPAKALPAPINTNYHNSCIALSPDGKEMILYSDQNGGDLIISYLNKAGLWTTPQPMEGINTEYIENSATLSADNKVLYFTSNRSGGYGGMDIYRAELGKNGRWTNIQNLGNLINTELDEESVFISANGKHLYFSSNGHAGMGDLDIYRTTFDSVTGSWQEPLNLGYPINSPENDIFFVLNKDETSAYFSSVRKNNIGEQDIYRIDMRNWKPVTIKPIEFANRFAENASIEPISKSVPPPAADYYHDLSVTYYVYDATTGKKINATIDAPGKISSFKELAEGQYHAILKASPSAPATYKISFSSPGYISQQATLHVGGIAEKPPVILDTIRLAPLSMLAAIAPTHSIQKAATATGTASPVKLDIHFAHDSDDLLSVKELDEIASYLRENEKITVELGGHTDSTGDETYNRILSQRRADAAKAYLVKKGIPADRITAVGYGSSNPIADNSTRDGRRLNRRTELKIIQ